MNYIKRTPNISVAIKRPDYNSSQCQRFDVVTFVPAKVSEEDKAKAKDKWTTAPQDFGARSDALLSYSYSESLYNVDSPFSLSLTPEADTNGLTWVDKIALMDLVFISELGKIRYCGLVHQVRYSARMGQDGPARTITISGNGFGELLKSFQLQMDARFWLGKIADTENKILQQDQLNDENTTLGSTMNMFYENFMKIVTEKPGGKTQASMRVLLDDYIDKSDLATSYKTVIPLAAGLYQVGVNNIWDMWQKLVPAPYGELFGRWDSKLKKYKLIARTAPFDPAGWKALDSEMVGIHPLVLTDYEIGVDDSEVRTCFYTIAPSLTMSEGRALVSVEDKDQKQVLFDEEKWSKYGYRPLATNMRYLKRDASKTNGIEEALADVSGLVKEWFSRNDMMLSGSISLISIDDSKFMTYPTVGNKVSFLGGQFYVEQVERKWTYGDSPRTELKVTRGYLYDNSGKPAGPIAGLGRRLKEVEASTYQNDGG